MERIQLSRSEIEILRPAPSTVGDLIGQLESHFLTEDKVICAIDVNGLKMTEEDELKFNNLEIGEVEHIEVTLDLRSDLVTRYLGDLIVMIPALKNLCETVSLSIRGKGEKPLDAFIDIFDSCDAIIEAIVHFKRFNSRAELWQKAEGSLSSTIKSLLDAFEKKDLVLVADILEYDLTSDLEVWLNLFDELSKSFVDRSENR